jgi:crotonobetainyl-CoA:carnitine CoA-transferase CaiB-like acyl-CoA transferase
LLDDPALQTNPQRVTARGRIAPLVKDLVAQHTFADMGAKLERLKIPYAPLAKPADLFDDPHLNYGNRMVETQFFNGKRAKLPALPLEMGDHNIGLRRQPPHKGEHSREVLREAGFDAAQIEAWVKGGVVIADSKS